MSELSILRERVMPRSFERKVEVATKIAEKQKNTVIIGRNLFHLFFHFFVKQDDTTKIPLDTLVCDVILENDDYISGIDPLPTQILINCLKMLYLQPKTFALSLIDSKLSEKEFGVVAYTTFPALFGYFTSQEYSESAGYFLLDMVTAGAPQYMVQHLVCSFLLSAYPFNDSLWCNFARKYERFAFPDTSKVHEVLIECINECVSLLPYTHFFILREIATNNIELAFKILFCTFLPMTFKIWSLRAPFALAVGKLNEVNKYFEENKNWPSDMAVCVIASFTKNKGRINTIPSYSNKCKLPSETMIFSKKDISFFCRMFQSISSKMTMFNELEKLAEVYPNNCYEAFSLSFFNRPSPSKPQLTGLISYNVSFANDFTPNAVLEKALQQYNESLAKGVSESSMHDFFRSKEFIEYKEKKEYSLLISKAQDQEEVICLSQMLSEIERFQASMKNQYRLISGCFMEELSDKIIATKELSLGTIEDIWTDVICGHESVTMEAFVEILNKIKYENIIVSRKLLDKVIRTIVQTKEAIDVKFRQSPTISGLPPMLTNRTLLKPGSFFVLIQFIINSIYELVENMEKVDGTKVIPIMVLKFVLRMSNCERNIIYFLFFEKIIFRSSCIRHFPQKIVNQFNLFFQAMWELIGSSPTLLQKLISLDLKVNFA